MTCCPALPPLPTTPRQSEAECLGLPSTRPAGNPTWSLHRAECLKVRLLLRVARGTVCSKGVRLSRKKTLYFFGMPLSSAGVRKCSQKRNAHTPTMPNSFAQVETSLHNSHFSSLRTLILTTQPESGPARPPRHPASSSRSAHFQPTAWVQRESLCGGRPRSRPRARRGCCRKCQS